MPFLSEETDGDLSLKHVELFLWVVSPGFSVDRTAARRFRRFRHSMRFLFRCRRSRQLEIANAVGEYIADAFADAPAGSGGALRVSYASWISRLVDLFGSEYGWSAAQVLALPVKVAFQQERQISLRYDGATILFNPSDAIRSEYLEKLNADRTNN
jgi:hypothetical protein